MGRYDDPQPKSPLPAVIGVSVAVVLIVALTLWRLGGEQKADKPATVNELALPQVQPETEGQAGGHTEPEPSIAGVSNEPTPETAVAAIEPKAALPPLKQSDALFRQSMTALSADLADLLQGEGLIEKYLQIVNDFSEGQRLYKHMRFLQLQEPFVAEQDGQGWYMSERSYRRYDRFARAFAAIDTQAAIGTYLKLRPLLQQVYTEFSYPEHYRLEDLFEKAASEIIGAPVIEERVALVRPTVRYRYADKKLETSSPVHKQMLRMGPDNTRMIQKKLRELVQEMAKLQVE